MGKAKASATAGSVDKSKQTVFRHKKRAFKKADNLVRAGGNAFLDAFGSKGIKAGWKGGIQKATEGLSRKQIFDKVAGDQELQELAQHAMRIDFFAGSTIRSYTSEVKKYKQFCENSGLQDFPLGQLSLGTLRLH